MKVTAKGQVTIPVEIRERAGILPGTEVRFEMDGETVILRRVEDDNHRGRSIVARMKGRATVEMTTDEIMALTRGEE